jgi:hypothetical protein
VRLRRVATRAGVLRELIVFVVAAPPDARLVAPLGGAVEPLIHALESVHSARIGGIGVVNNAVLKCERAHTRPLAPIGGGGRDFPDERGLGRRGGPAAQRFRWVETTC